MDIKYKIREGAAPPFEVEAFSSGFAIVKDSHGINSIRPGAGRVLWRCEEMARQVCEEANGA